MYFLSGGFGVFQHVFLNVFVLLESCFFVEGAGSHFLSSVFSLHGGGPLGRVTPTGVRRDGTTMGPDRPSSLYAQLAYKTQGRATPTNSQTKRDLKGKTGFLFKGHDPPKPT